MDFYRRVASEPDQFLVTIYDGPKVGEHPDIAAEVVRTLITESARQGESKRYHVVSLTLARNQVALRVKLNEQQMTNEHGALTEFKMIFHAVADRTYRKCKGFG